MTLRRGINSKYASKDFLQRGLRSMFPNYKTENEENSGTIPPPEHGEKGKGRSQIARSRKAPTTYVVGAFLLLENGTASRTGGDTLGVHSLFRAQKKGVTR